MTFIFFDQNDRILFRRSDAIAAHYVHEEFKHTATFPNDPNKPIQRGMRVGWPDRNKNLILCEIRLPVCTLPNSTVSYTAEHVCISELRDNVVQDKRSYGVSAYMALSSVLDGTEWSVGTASFNPQGSGNFYWIDSWESACKVRDSWGVRLRPRITFNGTQITGRYLDILDPSGTFHGVRLQLDRNVEQAGVTYDDRNLCTALYGRGKGEVVGTTSDGENTYGRKITFEDVVWSKADGDPADKPAGQLYVEDADATALYGRKGKRREAVVDFSDCEDPDELLRLTWEELQRRVVPSVTINTTVLNLHALGYRDQGLDLGDIAAVVIRPWNYRTMLKTVQLDEDLLSPENTRPVMGDYMANIVQRSNQTNKTAAIGQQIAQSAPSLLQGYIDTAVTVIMSSKTKRETLPDGSEIYISEDGSTAVRFTGTGILLASEKDATGDYIWRTAITGDGITADEITTGVLNAAAVKILGTNRFFWDAENICAINPENTNQQIRFGLYDGEHYGIGYTQDGGQTWQNAIGFDGISISATGFAKSYVQLAQPSNPEIGDRWTKTAPKTWEEVAVGTWGSIRSIIWNEALGYLYPQTFVWDGQTWLLESDMLITETAETFDDRIVKVETEVEQNAKAITERATKGELESLRVQTASSISQMVTNEQFDSAITQNTQNWTAEFNKIGLAGKQTGIVKADAEGVEVSHSNIGGKTSMNADGFRLYDSNGNPIGGLISVNGQLYAAVQSLMNPSYPGFRVGIADRDFESAQFGLHWVYNSTEQGAIYAYDGGMRHDVSGQLGMFVGNFVLSAGDCGVRFADGEIWFEFLDEDGDPQSWAISDMWNNVPKG